MFGAETTPLFSGTAPRGRVEVFSPRPYADQQSFAGCRFCRDTGVVDGKFCTCEAGQQARERARQQDAG